MGITIGPSPGTARGDTPRYPSSLEGIEAIPLEATLGPSSGTASGSTSGFLPAVVVRGGSRGEGVVGVSELHLPEFSQKFLETPSS